MSSTSHSAATEVGFRLRAELDRTLRVPVMFFLVSGAAWLMVAIVLGIVASAKIHEPQWLADESWLTYGRVFPAHWSALIYGWGMQTAFAMILWVMTRLTGKPCTSRLRTLIAGHAWNFGVAAGVIGILAGSGTGMAGLEFPEFAWPVLFASYCVIMLGPFVQFRVASDAGGRSVSAWYLLAAICYFPWVFATANLLLRPGSGHPVMAVGIASWYQSALLYLFFLPVAIGVAFFLMTKAGGMASAALAKLGFWSWVVIAPWAGMQSLVGAPIVYFLPYVGAAATVLLFVPWSAAAINGLRPLVSRRPLVAASPALRFGATGLAALALLALLLLVFNLPGSTLPLLRFTLGGYGIELLALYGVFGLVMFGGIYFMVPRITGSEWLSRRMMMLHYLFSVYALATLVMVAVVGGLRQGWEQEAWNQPWLVAAVSALPYAVANTFAWCLLLLANGAFFIHLLLMWLGLGRRNAAPIVMVITPPDSPAIHPDQQAVL